MRFSSASFARRSFLAASLALLGASCQATGKPPVEDTSWLAAKGLESAAPADIVVAPVRNQSADSRVPVEVLRGALAEGLVARLYSPLDLDYYDTRAREASFSPAELGADAVLQVTLTRWDDAALRDAGYVFIEGEAVLLDARSPEAVPLWGVMLARRVQLGSNEVRMGDWDALFHAAALRYSSELLALLPARKPSTAR